MKRKTIILFALASPFLLAVLTGCEEEAKMDTPIEEQSEAKSKTRLAEKLTWNYPVKPGTEEWNSLRTEEERISAVQIPESTLNNLTPEEVVELFVSFPLFGYFTAYNTPQGGFNVMLDRFNIFQHLLTRNDIGSGLIAVYKDAGMSGFQTFSYSDNYWTIKLEYIELILSQKEILQTLTQEERLDLLVESRNKYEEKARSVSFSSVSALQSTTRIMAATLLSEGGTELKNYSNKVDIDMFAETGVSKGIAMFNDIIRLADDYIARKTKM